MTKGRGDRLLIPSVNVETRPSHCCVCDFAPGVLSWHSSEEDAQHNADLTGGKALPVDYIGNELIVPSLAVQYVKQHFGLSRRLS